MHVPGGIIQLKPDGTYFESIQEVDRVWASQDYPKPDHNPDEISDYNFT